MGEATTGKPAAAGLRTSGSGAGVSGASGSRVHGLVDGCLCRQDQ